MHDRQEILRQIAASIVKADVPAFRRLIDAADFGARDLGEAFFYTAVHANYGMAKHLLAYIEPDETLLDRSLQGAAASGNTRFVRWLESLGADRRAGEDLAFGLATFRNRAVTSGYLIIKNHGIEGERLERSLRKAWARGFKPLALGCARLVTECASLDGAMHWAVRSGRRDFLLAALLAGGDPNVDHGELLLHAVRGGDVPLLRILLAQGADILATPPLVLTIEAKASGNADMVREVWTAIQRARRTPYVIRAGDVPSRRGMKTVAGKRC